MACTAIDLQTAYAAGANAAFAAAGKVPSAGQAQAITDSATAQYPLPGPALRVITLQVADGTNFQVRVSAGKLEVNSAGVWQPLSISIDRLGPSGLATLADLFGRPTA